MHVINHRFVAMLQIFPELWGLFFFLGKNGARAETQTHKQNYFLFYACLFFMSVDLLRDRYESWFDMNQLEACVCALRYDRDLLKQMENSSRRATPMFWEE